MGYAADEPEIRELASPEIKPKKQVAPSENIHTDRSRMSDVNGHKRFSSIDTRLAAEIEMLEIETKIKEQVKLDSLRKQREQTKASRSNNNDSTAMRSTDATSEFELNLKKQIETQMK